MNTRVPNGKWLSQPKMSVVTEDAIRITTEPGTDFWQRSYYGFRNDNAPAFLFESDCNFTFTVKANFVYQSLFDQCGVIIYLNNENWFKASIEYENDQFSRLGSVVTNLGHSDWATTDIKLPTEIWYRLSRRGPDFLIERSFDGERFSQMRIFHMYQLGETSVEMGKANPPLPTDIPVKFGVYACSPSDSSFTASFSELELQDCIWRAHGS
jgi:regulation of enolase protein 1 (concanavalin A-like superfamily)